MTTGELNYGEDNLKKREQSRQFDCVDEHSKWHDPPQVQTKADGTHRPRPRLERDCRRKGERSQPTDFFLFFFLSRKTEAFSSFASRLHHFGVLETPTSALPALPAQTLFCFAVFLSLSLLILEWLEASKRRRPSSSS